MRSIFIIFLSALAILPGQELTVSKSPSGIQFEWDRVFPQSSGVSSRIHSRLLSSTDLQHWTEEELLTVEESAGNGTSSHSAPLQGPARYFRLEESVSYSHRDEPSAPPALYNQQFLNATASPPVLPPLADDQSHADPNCLDRISWDPTTASFFAEYNTSPEDHNVPLEPDDPERRLTDFRLNAAELAAFEKNGFVVSPRIVGPAYTSEGELFPSYAPVDFYYSIWSDDLPVFITADSVLDAWHQTFNSMLEEVEELVLYPSLRSFLDQRLSPELQEWNTEWQDKETPGADSMRQALRDLDLYLGTAFRVARGTDPGAPDEDRSNPAHWQQSIIAAKDPLKRGLYGDNSRLEDMTLYTPRGHYTRSEVLKGYFQTIVWFSSSQFHLAGEEPLPQWDRELRAAIALSLIVRDSGGLPEWQNLENFLQGIAGQSDAMTVVEMIALLESVSLDDPSAITSDENLNTVREALLASSYGIQEINGGKHEADISEGCDHATAPLPRALSLFGQRWTPDAWTFQKNVFPEVKVDGQTVPRRIPSAIDVAYSTFGNDAAYPILLDRMLDSDGVPFRDGFDHRPNLRATRTTLDGQDTAFWTEHLYGSWLHSIRALSPPLPPSAPDTFRTEAWKHRILNTQLASWTHLRHDTLLYSKQSFTPAILCEFPDGYVDPYPALWQRLSDMALKYKTLLAAYSLTGPHRVESRDTEDWDDQIRLYKWNQSGYSPLLIDEGLLLVVDRGERLAALTAHLDNFSTQCLKLKQISEHQLAGQMLTDDMKTFIGNTVEDFDLVGYVGDRLYNGWFPNLYFHNAFIKWDDHPSSEWNPSVVDVHTDSIDILCYGDPGAILHQGVGRAHFMLISVKHPDGSACTYGGPVLSHYEFLKPFGVRMSDEQWQVELQSNDELAPADWKRSFLITE
ncbi:MAG: DUF3160 domain-containing protein [Verrucomicrobiaceae bacterium]